MQDTSARPCRNTLHTAQEKSSPHAAKHVPMATVLATVLLLPGTGGKPLSSVSCALGWSSKDISNGVYNPASWEDGSHGQRCCNEAIKQLLLFMATFSKRWMLCRHSQRLLSWAHRQKREVEGSRAPNWWRCLCKLTQWYCLLEN